MIDMLVFKRYCKKSICYKRKQHIKVKGIMLHSVGVPQAKAAPFIKTWNKSNGRAIAHAIITPSGKIYKTLPWNYKAWHCGSGKRGSGNNTHIGIEMTEPSTIKYLYGAVWKEKKKGVNTRRHVLKCYKHAVKLFAYLCKKYNLNPMKDGVIISHSEGYKKGIASNHADVEHLWKKYGLTMEQFRKDIKAKL